MSVGAVVTIARDSIAAPAFFNYIVSLYLCGLSPVFLS